MKILVTGVGGQLGHDVMNELAARGYDAIGSDIALQYSGVADESPVTRMPYMQMDITDAQRVANVLGDVKPDAVMHWRGLDGRRPGGRGKESRSCARNQCGGHAVYRRTVP